MVQWVPVERALAGFDYTWLLESVGGVVLAEEVSRLVGSWEEVRSGCGMVVRL